ncbi:MAG: hypothetical protein KJ064_25275 [Anaerolineae bacterium]|nr:hypothetical protein [Anaerolineae bacterium]
MNSANQPSARLVNPGERPLGGIGIEVAVDNRLAKPLDEPEDGTQVVLQLESIVVVLASIS